LANVVELPAGTDTDDTGSFSDASSSSLTTTATAATGSGVASSKLAARQRRQQQQQQQQQRDAFTAEEIAGMVDMSAPMVWQIHSLSKAQYEAWVHTPFHAGTQRAVMFGRAWIERLTRTPWWVVPTVWLPVVAALWAPYAMSASATLVGTVVLLAAGLLLWTIVEYTLHRWMFHMDAFLPDNGWLRTGHFIIHGIHHRLPMDGDRLVMPPIAAAPLTFGVWCACKVALAPLALPPHVFAALFGGGVLGYVAYDMVHYAFHHARMAPTSYLGRMKKYHMKHHFSGLHGLGMGITSPLWDWAFGTLLPPHVLGGATSHIAVD
jgi:sterol desaturase/sphingolipid hydroxylase (fatty acid hydroxylase superfamily)